MQSRQSQKVASPCSFTEIGAGFSALIGTSFWENRNVRKKFTKKEGTVCIILSAIVTFLRAEGG